MIKIIFSSLSFILSIYCFIPYIRDVFKKQTKPHMYSWFVWAILQSSAAIIMFMNGAGLGAISISIGAVFCLYIFFLSFKYGTKNIKRLDIVCLTGALVTIVFWIFTKDDLLSVILISIIDFVGFIPTFRKSYEEPNTETASLYVLSAVSLGCAIIAIQSYSLITVLYVASLFVTNAICAGIILSRRKVSPAVLQ